MTVAVWEDLRVVLSESLSVQMLVDLKVAS